MLLNLQYFAMWALFIIGVYALISLVWWKFWMWQDHKDQRAAVKRVEDAWTIDQQWKHVLENNRRLGVHFDHKGQIAYEMWNRLDRFE